MNSYYRLTEKLYELLLADEDINTVTKGKNIDINKKDVFPLGHINVLTATPTTTTITFSVSIIAADIRNHSNVPSNEKYISNDNEDDNLNAMMYVLIRLYLLLDKQEDEYRIITPPTLEPFLESRNNVIDGWEGTFEIELDIGEVTSC